MRTLVIRLLKWLKVDRLARILLRRFWMMTRKDGTVVKNYLEQQSVRKLHLGCGSNNLDGWLNSDLEPFSRFGIRIDATATFPFNDKTFDYAFSEHMIEHIPYEKGLQMLRESHRVLKDGGKIRISTPSLAFLLDLYKAEKSALQTDYLEWSTENFVKYAPRTDAVFVINNFFRDFGHSFIYDESTLRDSLERAGFQNVTKFAIEQSEDQALQNLEIDVRMPEGFVQLETFTLEGTK